MTIKKTPKNMIIKKTNPLWPEEKLNSSAMTVTRSWLVIKSPHEHDNKVRNMFFSLITIFNVSLPSLNVNDSENCVSWLC